MKFKIISYYTSGDKNNYYVKCANLMKTRCEELNYSYHIQEIPSKKTYNNNIKYKPIFIQECMKKFNEPLLFLDIDAELVGTIPDEMLDLENYDVGITKTWCDAHPIQEEEYKIHKNIPKTPNDLSIRDGFLYVNNTKASTEFLKLWDTMCKSKMYESWRSHRPLDHSMKLCLIENKPIKIKILSGYVNCCPTIHMHGAGCKRDQKDLLLNNKVFCFYRVSGSQGIIKNAIQ